MNSCNSDFSDVLDGRLTVVLLLAPPPNGPLPTFQSHTPDAGASPLWAAWERRSCSPANCPSSALPVPFCSENSVSLPLLLLLLLDALMTK